jgi:hypothetical protein
MQTTTIRRRRGRRPAARGSVAAAAVALVAALGAAAGGCGGDDSTAATTTTAPGVLPQGAEKVRLDPGNFTTKIDNPYMPLAPGSVWVYSETNPDGPPQRDVITVTSRTKVVAGVTARVIHDRATQGSEVIEDTFDWFAQDRQGNVWYLGEATQSYKNGKPSSTKGSWEAGRNGAQAGVVMPASPAPGLEYRQEYRRGKAEDRARVLSTDDQVESPVGHFNDAVLTKEFTPLEPNDLEYKLYAKGVGLVTAIGVSGDLARETLVSYRKGGG